MAQDSALASKPKTPIPWYRKTWDFLTLPDASITAPEERRRVRTLSALLVALFIFIVIGIFAAGPFLLLHAAATAVAYTFSRTRRYLWGAGIMVYMLASTTLFAIRMQGFIDPRDITLSIGWLTIPMVLSVIWFKPRGAIIAIIVCMIEIFVIVPRIQTLMSLNDISYTTSYISIFAAFLILFSLLRYRDLRQIASQTESLNNQNTELLKANEDLIVARRQAEEASELKSQFVSSMSHELRTPLHAIIGFSEIMLAGIGDIDLNDKTRHLTERINVNSLDLLNLINDVLDLAKIEARRVEIVNKPFSPGDLLRKIHAEHASQAEQQNLNFVLEVDPSLPQTLMGDETHLERVITNLLSNALKFTAKGGVTVAARKLIDDQWSVAVKDTGIGIPSHAFEFIFDPFRQLDGSAQRSFGGSGLGLAITQDFVKAMDGTIAIDSTVGEGATFTVTLPLKPVAQAEKVVVAVT